MPGSTGTRKLTVMASTACRHILPFRSTTALAPNPVMGRSIARTEKSKAPDVTLAYAFEPRMVTSRIF